MKTEKKRILLLGGSSQQVIAIETAKRLGLFTILCDYLPDNPGQYHADVFYQVSTTDKKTVLEIARKESIDCIIAYASDPAAPTAAFVAEELGLPTNSLVAVNTLCNKDLFRDFLQKNGFNTPKAIGFSNKREALAMINTFCFPIIIKPVDSSGSKGVTVLNNLIQSEEAIEYAFSFSRSHRIIIEEFIEMKHPYLIGGDIFIEDGRIIQYGLLNCHRDSMVNPLVPIGKSYPVLINPSDLLLVKKTLQDLVTKLGLRFGPMNVELIIDKNNRVFPIDIGPRSGGNMIPILLSWIFNCNEVEMGIRVALGEHLNLSFDDGEYYYATYNIHSNKNGYYESIRLNPTIKQFLLRKEIYKKRGDYVRYFENAADAIGILFFKFPDEETMISMEENMHKYVRVILKETS